MSAICGLLNVEGALADRQEINKSSFEIFVCILLTSNHMIPSAIWNK